MGRRLVDGSQSLPFQSMAVGGRAMPSHTCVVREAQLVKMVFSFSVSMADGFAYDVPGATPKNPASGLMAAACRRDRFSSRRCRHPAFGFSQVRWIIAGWSRKRRESAADVVLLALVLVSLKMSMCSAIQPSLLAMVGRCGYKHFFPKRVAAVARP